MLGFIRVWRSSSPALERQVLPGFQTGLLALPSTFAPPGALNPESVRQLGSDGVGQFFDGAHFDVDICCSGQMQPDRPLRRLDSHVGPQTCQQVMCRFRWHLHLFEHPHFRCGLRFQQPPHCLVRRHLVQA